MLEVPDYRGVTEEVDIDPVGGLYPKIGDYPAGWSDDGEPNGCVGKDPRTGGYETTPLGESALEVRGVNAASSRFSRLSPARSRGRMQ